MKWLEIAKSLRCGSRSRIPCCKADKTMSVNHDQKGYWCFCHRCGYSDFEPHGLRSVSDIIRHNEELKMQSSTEPCLPSDYTMDVPANAAMWYIKYGISPDDAQHYEIGYSPFLDRVVIPVYSASHKLIAVQSRAVEPDVKPKYINSYGANVGTALFQSEHHRNGGKEPITVVVEDVLSAIKVGKVYHSASILGTNLSDERAYAIAEHCERVVLWLDGDDAGDKGTKRACRVFDLIGKPYTIIKTPNDPKTYSRNEIRAILGETV